MNKLPENASEEEAKHLTDVEVSSEKKNRRSVKKIIWSCFFWGLITVFFFIITDIFSRGFPFNSGTALKAAERVRSTNNARNLAVALQAYAADHNDEFPEGNTASEVFSKLLTPDEKGRVYITDKGYFFVKGSAWTPRKIEGAELNRTLVEGENHWALMSGLKTEGNARWPLVFDGPANSDGVYTDKSKNKGGVWDGKLAIVVRLDCSAKAEKLTDLKVATDGQSNILVPTKDWAEGGKMLMPW